LNWGVNNPLPAPRRIVADARPIEPHGRREPPQVNVAAPQTPAEFEKYFSLRWEVLRAPWGAPRGAERDELDGSADHAVVWGESGEALAVGRLHLNSPDEAQIRYMAVAPAARGRGLGRLVVAHLEAIARARGAATVVLNARAEAQGFYERLHYCVEGPAPAFMSIPHFRMRKEL
jgi:ribosomal protein S18 acetylase RimI-like enzyme